ncbi:DUF885 domain-containing protein [Roseovarius nanhaiticus]|uniref:DUF885 domain-containing protein n=1 Tax=Roseovarius nanhaiticus TaxID=573024 RepID=UPI002492A8D9|nr:DUF885 domain-containing protein [Roseovarius nanhaiticus]
MSQRYYPGNGGITRRGVLGAGAAAGFAPLLGTSVLGQTASVTEICNTFVDRFAETSPILSGRVLGVGRNGGDVTDWSVDGAERTANLLRDTVAQLDATPPADRKEEIAAGFLRDNCDAVLKGHEAGEHLRRMSTSIFTGPPAMLLSSFDLMERHTHGEIPVDRAERDSDWNRVAERMEAVPGAMSGYVQSLQTGLEAGLPASRRMTLAVADQCRSWAEAGWFASYVAGYDDGSLRTRLEQAATAADRAYGETAAWLRDTYAPEAADAIGIGAERFAIQADIWLGLQDLDLDATYAWATEDYSRLVAEQEREAARVQSGASLAEVRATLDTDPAHNIEGIASFRDWAQALVDEAIAVLGRTEFDIPPQLRACEVRMTEAGSGAMPFYLAPPEDFSSAAAVVWPTLGQTRLPTWSAVTTVFHESVPGHHLQLGGTRLLDLTRVQRVGASAGHAEGWALYAERLMDELGWFDTPAKRLGFLSMQAFRAARVIVDIGLHTGRKIPTGFPGAGERWSEPRAIEAIANASGFAPSAAALEVERYLGWPAQACSYKLGERTWIEGRAAAQSHAGASFDRKRWHADALALGPLGLTRLARELSRI